VKTSIYTFPLFFLVLPIACSVEDSGDDDGGAAGTSNTSGTSSGSTGKAGSAGSSGAGGKAGAASGGAGTGGGAGTSAGSSAGGSAGSLGGAGTGGGGVAGAGGAGKGGIGGASGSGGAGNAGSAGSSGSGGALGGAGSGGTAGNAGGTAGSSGSSSTGFDPCPATGECVILPLGDSITDGIGFSGGYRVELFHLALQDDHEITFVGGSMNGPTMVDGVTFPRSHEGHSGWTIQQIDGIVPEPALGPDPNIILLHIGTNDMRGNVNGASDRLGTLIDQIIEALPDSLLVVSNIIPYPAQSSQVMTYNAAVPGVVNARTDAGKHVLFVDQFEGFPTSELGDGVHPNQAGYERMAGKWYTAISSYLH
jgi:lysophospholipase L1-like esterase